MSDSKFVGAPYDVPWGQSWDCGGVVFWIEDIHVNGRYRHTESYGFNPRNPEMHNPIGHFSGSRERSFAELRRMARIYHCEVGERCTCQIYTDSTCNRVRWFLTNWDSTEPMNG